MEKYYFEKILATMDPASTLLVRKYYNFYRKLELGIIKPKTEAQERFVLVCRGFACPLNGHEKAYREYIQKRGNISNEMAPGSKPTTPKKSAKFAKGVQPDTKKKSKDVKKQPYIEGCCRKCGCAINPKRLELYPQEKLCVPCKSDLEDKHPSGGKRKIYTDEFSGSREANKKMRNWRLS